MNASLRRCGLEERTIFLLESKKIKTSHDVLRLTPLDLVQVLDVPLARAREIVSTVGSSVARRVARTTALHMKEEETRDPRSARTGLDTLDAILNGGVRPGTITEFVGPAGSGKSQVCMQVAVFATLPQNLGGLDGKVLYFDAETHFRPERIAQIARARFPDRFASLPPLQKLLSRVLVSEVSSLSHLESLLPNVERAVLEHSIRCIVIDNIAVLARTEFTSSEDLVARQDILGRIASRLKKVACAYRIPIVVTNQIMSLRSPANHNPRAKEKGGDRKLGAKIGGIMRPICPEVAHEHYTAALGAKWAHYISTRVSLTHSPLTGGRLFLIKSPFAPETALSFKAGDEGLVEVKGGNGGSEGVGADPPVMRGLGHQQRTALQYL